jgi:branched-chain amino acid transport system substrate-binding protein
MRAWRNALNWQVARCRPVRFSKWSRQANAYDAAGQLLQAIGAVGNDRTKVREYLANMNTKEKGYKGVTGITFFDENGDCVKAAFMKTVKNGKFQAAPKQMEK